MLASRGALFPRRRVALIAVALAIAIPLCTAAAFAPRLGAYPFFGLAALAGPVAVAGWWSARRPVAVLLSVYVGLAPVDAFLQTGAGFTLGRLAGLLAIPILLLGILRRGTLRAPVPGAVVLWVVTLAWMAFSLAWAADLPVSLSRLTQTGLPIVLLALLVYAPCTRADLRVLLIAVIGVGVGVATYAVILAPPLPGAGEYRLWITAATNSIDPNALGFALLVPLALAVALVAEGPTRIARLAAGVAVPLLVGGVLASQSRGAFLGMLALMLVLALRARRRVVPIAFLTLGTLASVAQGGAWQRLFSDTASDAQGAGRLPIWKIGWEAFRQHWLVGAGYGGFPEAYNQAYLSVPHSYYTGWSRVAHSIVISSLVELGIVGAPLLFAAWLYLVRDLQPIKADDPDRWLRDGLQAGVIATFIAALFLDVLTLKAMWVAPLLIVTLMNVRALRDAPANRSLDELRYGGSSVPDDPRLSAAGPVRGARA